MEIRQVVPWGIETPLDFPVLAYWVHATLRKGPSKAPPSMQDLQGLFLGQADPGCGNPKALPPTRATLSLAPPRLEENLQLLQHQQRAGCAEKGSKQKRAFVGPAQRPPGCSLRAVLEHVLVSLATWPPPWHGLNARRGSSRSSEGSTDVCGSKGEGSTDVCGRDSPVCQWWHSSATTNNSAAPKEAFLRPASIVSGDKQEIVPQPAA